MAAMAAGEKLRDDPALLRRAIKRREKRKQQSQRRWFVILVEVRDNHFPLGLLV